MRTCECSEHVCRDRQIWRERRDRGRRHRDGVAPGARGVGRGLSEERDVEGQGPGVGLDAVVDQAVLLEEGMHPERGGGGGGGEGVGGGRRVR